MKTRRVTKTIRVGEYLAEVDVDLVEDETGWSPYLSLEAARRLDAVRDQLRHGRVEDAARVSRVFTLTPCTGV